MSRTRIVDRYPIPPRGCSPSSEMTSMAHCMVSAKRLLEPFSSAPVRNSVLLKPAN